MANIKSQKKRVITNQNKTQKKRPNSKKVFLHVFVQYVGLKSLSQNTTSVVTVDTELIVNCVQTKRLAIIIRLIEKKLSIKSENTIEKTNLESMHTTSNITMSIRMKSKQK